MDDVFLVFNVKSCYFTNIRLIKEELLNLPFKYYDVPKMDSFKLYELHIY